MYKNLILCIVVLLLMGCSAMNFGSSPLNTAIVDNNLGCDYENQGDYAKAVEYFQKSADAGFYGGKANLARCYWYGIGVSKNPAYAVSLAIEPAQRGLAMAQVLLGEAMYFGIGTQQDVQNGYTLIYSAASKGDNYAKNLLRKIDQEIWQYKLQQSQNQAYQYQLRLQQAYQYQLRLQQDAARYVTPQNTRQRVTPKNTPRTPDPQPAPIEDAPDKLD